MLLVHPTQTLSQKENISLTSQSPQFRLQYNWIPAACQGIPRHVTGAYHYGNTARDCGGSIPRLRSIIARCRNSAFTALPITQFTTFRHYFTLPELIRLYTLPLPSSTPPTLPPLPGCPMLIVIPDGFFFSFSS